MIVFGVGASTCGAKCGSSPSADYTEVAYTTVPAGTSTGAANLQAGSRMLFTPLSVSPTRTQSRRSRCSAG